MTETVLREYVDRTRSVIADSKDLSLRNTELRLVEPFLDVLGWDVRLPEVEADVSVSPERGPVDYALQVDTRPAVFVDVVPCEESLREEDIDRLGAAMTAAGVDWGILTNGRSFVFLARDGEHVERLECRLDELPAHEDAVTMYTKAAAESRSGPADRRVAAERITQRRDAVVENLTETLVAATDGAAADDLASVVDEFVDDLIGTLGREDSAEDGRDVRDRPADATGPTEPRRDGPEATNGNDPEPAATEETGEYVVRFFDGRNSIGAVGTESHVGTMASAIEYLVDQCALDSRLSLPWRPEASADEGRAVLARTPVHPSGAEMRTHRRLSNGYCLLATLDVDSSKTVVRELADQSGLRVMFQGDW